MNTIYEVKGYQVKGYDVKGYEVKGYLRQAFLGTVLHLCEGWVIYILMRGRSSTSW